MNAESREDDEGQKRRESGKRKAGETNEQIEPFEFKIDVGVDRSIGSNQDSQILVPFQPLSPFQKWEILTRKKKREEKQSRVRAD